MPALSARPTLWRALAATLAFGLVAGVATPAAASAAQAEPASGLHTASAPGGDDWLHVSGNRIVDSKGRSVWITGANWFGFNTTERVLHGLWQVNLETTLSGIASKGINTLRVPISTQLLLEWKAGKAKVPGAVNFSTNPKLKGKTSLQIFDAFLAACKARGIKVILNVHSAKADNSGHLAPMWYSGDISTADFYAGWVWVATRYKANDTIIGFDLKNEPHGQPGATRARWDGSTGATNWRYVAQTVGNKILKVHPNALIIVEGVEVSPKSGKTYASTNAGDYYFTWWGGNLRQAKKYPVSLSVKNRVVYSPHDYGPLVYNQPWFQKSFTTTTLTNDVWNPNWLYLHNDKTAPVLIGEWGGRLGQDARQDKWMKSLRDVIVSKRLSHTFWAINPNSADTGGLLKDDWKTWDSAKYALLMPALWKDSKGKFVSLDHAVPLTGGVSVTQYYAAGNKAP